MQVYKPLKHLMGKEVVFKEFICNLWWHDPVIVDVIERQEALKISVKPLIGQRSFEWVHTYEIKEYLGFNKSNIAAKFLYFDEVAIIGLNTITMGIEEVGQLKPCHPRRLVERLKQNPEHAFRIIGMSFSNNVWFYKLGRNIRTNIPLEIWATEAELIRL